MIFKNISEITIKYVYVIFLYGIIRNNYFV